MSAQACGPNTSEQIEGTRRGIKPLSAVVGFPRPLTICDWCHSLIALPDGPVFAPATAAKILRMIPKAGRPNRKIGYPPKTLRAQSPPPCKRSPKATKNFKKMQDLESELGNRRTEHARCRLTRRANSGSPALRNVTRRAAASRRKCAHGIHDPSVFRPIA